MKLIPKEQIALALLFAGSSEVIGGLLFGRIANAFGRNVPIVFGTISHALALIFTSFLTESKYVDPTWQGVSWSCYCAFALFGFSDSAYNTQTWAILGDYFPNNAVAAFTTFNFVVVRSISCLYPIHSD